eukprot:756447-Hanusia_phi.AAC.4
MTRSQTSPYIPAVTHQRHPHKLTSSRCTGSSSSHPPPPGRPARCQLGPLPPQTCLLPQQAEDEVELFPVLPQKGLEEHLVKQRAAAALWHSKEEKEGTGKKLPAARAGKRFS